MSSGSHGSTSQAAPWGRLRAWIDEKEAWERQHQAPAHLSSKELAAIANLVSFIPEPDVSDEDYVSALLRYIQARQLERPTFTDEGPVDITVNGLTESRWRCYCSLPWVNGRFPRVGHGFREGEEPPAFKSKKNAKQFAAQQTLEFLGQSKAAAPAEDKAARSPPGQPPRSKKIKTGNTSPSRASPGQASNPKGKSKSTSSSDDDGNGGNNAPSIYECVARLARRLGVDPPVYRIEPDGDLPNYYRGWAQFKLGSRTPDDLGLVRGVLNKSEAKVQVAENVLVWLQKEWQERQDAINSVLSRAHLATQ